MQEDKMDKRLASSLRQAQEDSPIPYEIGAWEAFEKKRKAAKIQVLSYWISGVAASLVVLFLAFNRIDFSTLEPKDQLALQEQPSVDTPSLEIQSEQRTRASVDTPSQEVQSEKIAGENEAPESVHSREQISAPAKTKGSPSQGNQALASKIAGTKKSGEEVKKNQEPMVDSKPPVIPGNTGLLAVQTEEKEEKKAPLTAPGTEQKQSQLAMGLNSNSTEKDSVEKAKVELLQKQIAELTGADQVEEEKELSPWDLALGVMPGYGAGNKNNRNVSSSTLGLGVQMNLALSDKVSFGSGMGVNYFTQTATGQSVLRTANAAYPVNEKTDVQQVQVDIPLYVTYPVTRNRAISLQAGFSNIVAFDQQARQEAVYTRQVAVMDGLNSSTNSIAFTSESVSDVTDLGGSQSSKFYPFATANLGVNIRVVQAKKTSYLLMPFYNYPIQDISGTGSNVGFFGAALKVNFGVIQKK